MYMYNMFVTICYQIIMKHGDGITVVKNTRQVSKGACHMHYQIFIQKACDLRVTQPMSLVNLALPPSTITNN